MRCFWACLSIVAIVASTSPASALDYGDLPAERFPSGDWSDISWSDPGGWSEVDVTEHGVTPGSGDVRAALDSLLATVDSPTVLYFPEGTYTLDSGGDLVIETSDLIFRGDGAHKTVLELGDGQGEIAFRGEDTGSEVFLAADVAAGESVISLDSTQGLEVGDLVRIAEDAPQWEEDWGRRSNGVIALVTARDTVAETITINVPVDTGLTDANSPSLQEIRPVENVGVEKLAVHRTADNNAHTLTFDRVHNAFVREVESIDTARHHVQATRSHRVVVAHNYLHGARDIGGGGNGYGVAIHNLSTHALVTDNIIESTRHALMTQTGASYNVFAYNFHVDLIREDCLTDPPAFYCGNSGDWFDNAGHSRLTDVSVHGHFVRHTLYEGNVVYFIESTDFWGEAGPEITFFRNKVRGQPRPYGYLHEGVGILLGLATDRQNVVANVLINGSDFIIDHAGGQLEDLFVEGNIVDGSAEWDALDATSALPNSLYLDAPPSFWPSDMVWPPFGPHIEYASTNQVPAERRYWDGDPMGTGEVPQPPGDTGLADAGEGDVGVEDTGSPNVDAGNDAGVSDASDPEDASEQDVGAADIGQGVDSTDEKEGCGCVVSGESTPVSVVLVAAWLVVGWGARRRKRG
jgi:MYXO-CTERM domain-containing protein